MDFNSLENKELLWNILLEHKLFNGISQKELPSIRNNFEQFITNISKQPNKNTLELNKEFIYNFKHYLNILKKNQIREIDINDKSKLLKEQQVAFKIKQDDYNNNSIPPLPKTLESIKEEDPINIDEAMSKLIEERNLILPNPIIDENKEHSNMNERIIRNDNINDDNMINDNMIDNMNDGHIIADNMNDINYIDDKSNNYLLDDFKNIPLEDKVNNIYKELLEIKKIIVDNIN